MITNLITPELAWGHFSNNWVSLTSQPLLILVGLTGVGKSTVTKALLETSKNFTVLPNRRTLTDQLIIPTFAPPTQAITCRIKRLSYTRRYQQLYPGGMAYVLSQLHIHPRLSNSLLLFDGLRGEQELIYAAKTFPLAQFLVLEVPESIRLGRLLNRQDVFDTIDQNDSNNFAHLNIPEASSILTLEEQGQWLQLVKSGKVQIAELRDKLKIMLEERRNYQPEASRAALIELASTRTLIINTANYSPEQIAQITVKKFNNTSLGLSKVQ